MSADAFGYGYSDVIPVVHAVAVGYGQVNVGANQQTSPAAVRYGQTNVLGITLTGMFDDFSVQPLS
jgi:hypothetical protein